MKETIPTGPKNNGEEIIETVSLPQSPEKLQEIINQVIANNPAYRFSQIQMFIDFLPDLLPTLCNNLTEVSLDGLNNGFTLNLVQCLINKIYSNCDEGKDVYGNDMVMVEDYRSRASQTADQLIKTHIDLPTMALPLFAGCLFRKIKENN